MHEKLQREKLEIALKLNSCGDNNNLKNNIYFDIEIENISLKKENHELKLRLQ